jgi:hypothetical protein
METKAVTRCPNQGDLGRSGEPKVYSAQHGAQWSFFFQNAKRMLSAKASKFFVENHDRCG